MILSNLVQQAPLLMAAAALVTAGWGVVRGSREDRAARERARAEAAAADADAEVSSGRLGLEERQWIMKVAHADNERLRQENTELREEVASVRVRLDEMEQRMARISEENGTLHAHVERCETELARLRAS